MSVFTGLFVLLTTFITFIFFYFHNSYKYWTRKGVPTINPSIPLGNSNTLLPKGFSVGTLSKKFYDELKQKGHKFGGVYFVTEPNLVLTDPDYIRDIMGKDFQHFVNRGFYYNKKIDPLSGHLFALDGTDWRNIRIKLTPTFTSGKMKMMFQLVVNCSKNIKAAVEKKLSEDVDFKEVMGMFTTDVIGCCAFGIECDSFKNPDAEFRRMGLTVFKPDFWETVRNFLILNFPNFSKKFQIPTNKKQVQKFFLGAIADTVEYREKNGVSRKDFLQLLIELKNNGELELEEVAAQAFLFFLAGFESSSSTMAWALYELAMNEEVQEKLREEIWRVCGEHGGEMTYEGVMEMKYLAQVIDETLRKYPPLATLSRRCSKTYTLRDTNITIEEGTRILIPVMGLHMDPEIYPEPESFNPERFTEENKSRRHPFVHLPFGDGPRNCIGLRFGLMQSKVGVASVIRDFKLTVSPATKPVEFDPTVFILSNINKVFLKAEKL